MKRNVNHETTKQEKKNQRCSNTPARVLANFEYKMYIFEVVSLSVSIHIYK